jgi:membrane-bound metal-dependent hydrolase YbcI (DUF457 family)
VADFKTHITTSTVLGVAYASAGHFMYEVSIPHALVAGVLCSVAGMLPDLDSDSGVPIREMLSFVAVVVPMLMLRRFNYYGWSPETMVFVAGLMYIGIRFGLGSIFRRFTKHRGMWHSIPAAIIAGLITYLLCLSPELGVRLFKSWAVVLGFISHLMLDEIYSVDLSGRRVRLKSSSGTAMKFYGQNSFANITAYTGMLFFAFLVFQDRCPENFKDLPYGIDLTRIREKIEETAQKPRILK